MPYMNGVTNPRILDALNTVEVEMRNEYHSLEVRRQRDGNHLQVALAALYTIQIQILISLHSGNHVRRSVRANSELNSGVLNEYTVLVQVEATSL